MGVCRGWVDSPRENVGPREIDIACCAVPGEFNDRPGRRSENRGRWNAHGGAMEVVVVGVDARLIPMGRLLVCMSSIGSMTRPAWSQRCGSRATALSWTLLRPDLGFCRQASSLLPLHTDTHLGKSACIMCSPARPCPTRLSPLSIHLRI